MDHSFATDMALAADAGRSRRHRRRRALDRRSTGGVADRPAKSLACLDAGTSARCPGRTRPAVAGSSPLESPPGSRRSPLDERKWTATAQYQPRGRSSRDAGELATGRAGDSGRRGRRHDAASLPDRRWPVGVAGWRGQPLVRRARRFEVLIVTRRRWLVAHADAPAGDVRGCHAGAAWAARAGWTARAGAGGGIPADAGQSRQSGVDSGLAECQ